ncbi:uncharacterized protein C17orf100 homolog isoform X3 [Rhinopithecus roxellana]|uniref:uncharacterized protein C17orf100 homolog isoform X3 n=1 Tax=Rhinopithecus roxellana TaxID=61622 RepID=UPI0012378B31|nr:uncharacterized protein C17orf100 homolog isoform X3 [Rhinopithecus roxellana]
MLPAPTPDFLPAPQGGTLFEADFSLLDGIKANVILCSQQHLAAPLVMLKLQPDGKLLPMVIQGLKGEVEAGGGTRRAVSAECWRQSSLQGANAPSGSNCPAQDPHHLPFSCPRILQWSGFWPNAGSSALTSSSMNCSLIF